MADKKLSDFNTLSEIDITNTVVPILVWNVESNSYENFKVTLKDIVPFGNLGDVKPTTYDTVPPGGGWADGSEYTGYNMDNSKGQLPNIYDLLITGILRSVDYSTFDNCILNYGWCGVFALDTVNKKFKVPKITSLLQVGVIPTSNNKKLGRELVDSKKATPSDPSWYNLYSDGWCEQGGIAASVSSATVTVSFLIDYIEKPTCGVMVYINNTSTNSYQFSPYCYEITTSKASFKKYSTPNCDYHWTTKGYAPIPTGQPTDRYYIALYGDSVPASVAQTAEFMSALNNKASVDLDNLSTLGISKIRNQIRAGYQSGVTIPSGTIAPSDGWVYLKWYANKTAAQYAYIDGTEVFTANETSPTSGYKTSMIFIEQGSVLTMSGTAITATFFPTKGV